MNKPSAPPEPRHLLAPTFTSIVLGLMLVLAPAMNTLASERVLEQQIPADDIDFILLDAGNGSARIRVGDDDTIQVRVQVSPEKWSDDETWKKIKDWFLTSSYDDVSDLMNGLELEADRSGGGRLRIDLSPSVRVRSDKIREDWEIAVPARLAIKLAMARASTEIRGVAGGVELSLGNGSAEVDVPGGDLDIEVTVGKAWVRTASESVRRITVKSQVGNTSLWMNGMRIKYSDPPGPGSEVSSTGDGDDVIKVSLTVGDASLRVNTP